MGNLQKQYKNICLGLKIDLHLIYKYKASVSLNFYEIKFNGIIVTDYNVYVNCLNCMGYIYLNRKFRPMGGGVNFGGPVTEGGSHAKKVGDHWYMVLFDLNITSGKFRG